MKRILTTVVILSVLAVSSCKKDDDAGTSEDPIVGTWKYTKVLVDGKEGTPLSDCEKKGNYVFKADGTAEDNYYDDVNTACELDKGTGTWKKNTDGTYTGTFKDAEDDYTENFTLEGNELKIIDNLEPIVDIYTKQ